MSNDHPMAIIGNGGAAIAAVRALRDSGYGGAIRLITDYSSPAYNPVLLSYYVAGKINRQQCFPYGYDWAFYREHNIELITGSPVVALDCLEHEIVTGNGERITYDKCLVASGARPIVLPIPGIDSTKIHCLRTLEDADRLKAALELGPQKVLVVGSSMVGFKMVEVCLQLGIKVSLADITEHVLPRSAHVECAKVIESWLTEQGVELLLNKAMFQVNHEDSEAASVHFKSAAKDDPKDESTESHHFDLIVFCVGVKANTDFINPSQIHVDQGILVDTKMRTSNSDVYAAGDVAQAHNLQTGQPEIIGLWSNALYQGRTAGRNMAGRYDTLPGSIPHNIISIQNMHFASVGYTQACSAEALKIYEQDGARAYLAYCDTHLEGTNLYGNIESAGILKQAIVGQRDGVSVPLFVSKSGTLTPSL